MMPSFLKSRVVIGVVILVLAVAAWAFYRAQAPRVLLPIAEGDSIASWSFKGAYTGNPTLEAQARAEIERISHLQPTGQIPIYQIDVGIAAQYELLGDGAQAYAFLNKAAAIDPTHTGLAWANLGELMERLGAFNTGRVAYARAVEAEPKYLNYHIARLEFLTAHFPDDTAAVEGAFSEAETQFGNSAPILQIQAEWLASVGRTREAIAAWRKVESLVGTQPNIEQEIRRLQNKL